MPPMGIAIWASLSPLNVRCGPLCRSSSVEYGGFASSARLEAFVEGTAAPSAAEEAVTRNSRRVGLSTGDIESLHEACVRRETILLPLCAVDSCLLDNPDNATE